MKKLPVMLALLAAGAAAACVIQNPYSESIHPGHYRGFEWAEERDVGSCPITGSRSFIEGCEEYLRQTALCAEPE